MSRVAVVYRFNRIHLSSHVLLSTAIYCIKFLLIRVNKNLYILSFRSSFMYQDIIFCEIIIIIAQRFFKCSLQFRHLQAGSDFLLQTHTRGIHKKQCSMKIQHCFCLIDCIDKSQTSTPQPSISLLLLLHNKSNQLEKYRLA